MTPGSGRAWRSPTTTWATSAGSSTTPPRPESTTRRAWSWPRAWSRPTRTTSGPAGAFPSRWASSARSVQLLGDAETARAHHARSLELARELAEADPDDVQAQIGLVMSCQRLGLLEKSLGSREEARSWFLDGWQRLRPSAIAAACPRPMRRCSANLSKRSASAVFALGEATVNQVVETIPSPPTAMAVRRMMHILEEKGHLRRRESGREVIYVPRQAKDKAGRHAFERVLETFFGARWKSTRRPSAFAKRPGVGRRARAADCVDRTGTARGPLR